MRGTSPVDIRACEPTPGVMPRLDRGIQTTAPGMNELDCPVKPGNDGIPGYGAIRHELQET